MLNLSREEIESLIDLPQAAQAIEEAFRATSEGRVNLPPVGHITFPDYVADCHIKYGHVIGEPTFVIKVANGFPQNVDKGLKTGYGLVLVMSAQTGEVEAVLHDEMVLTDVRTGLGGAIATRLLARKSSRRVLIVGTGTQAQRQVEAHVALLPNLATYELWGRNAQRAADRVSALSQQCDIRVADDLEQAVRAADVVITTTGSTAAYIMSDWVQPGTHITAVGADAPGKQELDIALVARADVLAVDLISQCVDHGEVSYAVKDGFVKEQELIELGTLLAEPARGRTNDQEISIADSTGIAAQDIAMANSVLASWKASGN